MLRRKEQWLTIAAFAALIAFALWFCGFAIIESDYHWHVAAGRLMRDMGGFIRIDPFAWTREGLAYGSNHEWLAQVIFSFIADIGVSAEIVFRSLIVALTAIVLLSIGGRTAWLGLPLAIIVLTLSIGGFTDRPQLFTFLLLALSLWTALSYLERPNRRLLVLFPVMHILWINVHGAAAVLNAFVVGALFLQECWNGWRAGWESEQKRSIGAIAIALLALLPASLLSPMGTENLSYLLQLKSDATVNVIQEWRPRMLATYAKELWPIFAMAIAALALGRRHVPFALIILLPLLWLSRQAYRHEMLLNFAVLGIVMHQLKIWRPEGRKFWIATALIIVSLVPLTLHARAVRLGFIQRNHAYGTLRDRVGGAVVFLQREGIALGKPFNTYNLGSELDGALQPLGGKVFVDGRNIDFGDTFLTPLFAAATTAQGWDALERQYGFTVALIDYEEPAADEPMPYIAHLRDNPSWMLVFMNDFTAVYLKDVPSNHPTMQSFAYRFIDPVGFRRTPNPTTETVKGIETELKRMMREDPDGIRAGILLARLYASNGLLEPAETIFRDLVKKHPQDYRPLEELALMLTKAHRFEEAAYAFDRMRDLLGTIDGPDIHAAIADAFDKQGATEWAERYR